MVERTFPGSRILLLPLAAFSASNQSVYYALRRLSEISFSSAVHNNLSWLDMLEHSEGPIAVETDDAVCEINLREDLSVMYAKTDLEILPDEWVAPANYLEVGIVPAPGSTKAAHSISGDLTIDGIAVARHKFFPDEVASKADAAWSLLSRVRGDQGFPLRVSVVDSVPNAIMTRHKIDILPDILPLVDTRFSEAVVELAFASEPWTSQELDLSINSVMNEAAGGMHIALGTGLHGAHIDFISNRASVTWKDETGTTRESPARGEFWTV